MQSICGVCATILNYLQYVRFRNTAHCCLTKAAWAVHALFATIPCVMPDGDKGETARAVHETFLTANKETELFWKSLSVHILTTF